MVSKNTKPHAAVAAKPLNAPRTTPAALEAATVAPTTSVTTRYWAMMDSASNATPWMGRGDQLYDGN